MQWPGSRRKIEELVEQHYRSLYAYAYRLSGCQAQAEDLTQETFCQAQAKFSQLRESQLAKAWLFTILRNLFLQRLRDDKSEAWVPLDEVGEVASPWSEPLPDVDPAQLQQALDELPEAFRSPLILFYFEDFSYREIADQLGVAIGTVMSRLARAKAFLKQRLEARAKVGTGGV